VAALESAGHEAVRISRSFGVDLLTGAAPDEALRGAEAVVDADREATLVPACEPARYAGSSSRTTSCLF
jgi:hypothetical protein